MMTTTNANAHFWNRAAEKYAAQPVGDAPAFERKKAITRELLTPKSHVLEIGCGTGSLALEMAPFAGRIHAMDISSEMVRIASEKKDAQGITNVTFHEGTLDGAGDRLFEPAAFDAVWAYSILHLVDDRRGTLERLFALLAPGGHLVASNVCLSWFPYAPMIAVMRMFGKAPKVHLYDRETILQELEEVGFRDVTVHDVGASARVTFLTAKKP